MMKAEILIVDDDESITAVLREQLEADGNAVRVANNSDGALRLLRERHADLVLTDLNMPGEDGLQLVERAQKVNANTEFILMTAYASVENARLAFKRGVVDYLVKPFSIRRDLIPLIHQVLEQSVPASEPVKPSTVVRAGHVQFRSTTMRTFYSQFERAARSSATVLLLGESGTGKEVFAGELHELSARSRGPLVKVNCAALPAQLLESELFGHVKGAFSSALRDREGYFAVANGGTLFLDEIGELPLDLQPKLLRVLETGEYFRVGDSRSLQRADVRIVAATNRSLQEAVGKGTFREDLYYRLNVIPLSIPPLRERREDVEPLIEKLLARIAPQESTRVSPEARERLIAYSWPGNVRELLNALEYALVFRNGEEIQLSDLPLSLRELKERTAPVAPASPKLELRASEEADALAQTLENLEISTILKAMRCCDFNRSRAAEILGITRRTLGYRIGKYDLEERLTAMERATTGTAREGL